MLLLKTHLCIQDMYKHRKQGMEWYEHTLNGEGINVVGAILQTESKFVIYPLRFSIILCHAIY